MLVQQLTKRDSEALRALDITSLGLPPEPLEQEKVGSTSEQRHRAALAASPDEEADTECPICQDLISAAPATTTGCKHQYHTACILKWKERCEALDQDFQCCVCRRFLTRDYAVEAPGRPRYRSMRTPRPEDAARRDEQTEPPFPSYYSWDYMQPAANHRI